MILTPERRFLTVQEAEIRVEKGPNGARKLIGYAAKFDKLSQNLGGFVEKIHPKAFEKALKTADVRLLRNHDPDKLMGRTKSGTLRLFTDKEGLGYEGTYRNTQVWNDTLEDIDSKDLDGSSFSFTTEDEDGDDWDDTTDPPTRTLLSVRDLFDVGPVTYPAYLDTTASARALERWKHHGAVRSEQWFKMQRLKILKLRLGLLTS